MTLRILSLQCLLAFAKPGVSPEALSTRLTQALGTVFDLPAEKRAQKSGREGIRLRSSRTSAVCELASTHGAMNVPFAGVEHTSEDILGPHLASLAVFSQTCVAAFPVIRLGIVGSFFFEAENPASLVGHKYLKRFQEEKVAELSIRFNAPLTIEASLVNNVTSLTDGVMEIAAQGLKARGLIIGRDLNTALAQQSLDRRLVNSLFGKSHSLLSRSSILSHVQ